MPSFLNYSVNWRWIVCPHQQGSHKQALYLTPVSYNIQVALKSCFFSLPNAHYKDLRYTSVRWLFYFCVTIQTSIMNNLHQIIFIKYFRNVSTTINKNNLDITYFRPWASNSNMRVSLKEKVVMPLIFFNAFLHT